MINVSHVDHSFLLVGMHTDTTATATMNMLPQFCFTPYTVPSAYTLALDPVTYYSDPISPPTATIYSMVAPLVNYSNKKI